MKIPFHERVRTFNKTFGLPAPGQPVIGDRAVLIARMLRFQEIIKDEISECDDIIRLLQQKSASDLDIATAMSDWLCDIQVYAASEMVRHGLPNELVIDCIMDSQDTKLGPGGVPIVRDGKVIKGPKYRPPEPDISLVLSVLMGLKAPDVPRPPGGSLTSVGDKE